MVYNAGALSFVGSVSMQEDVHIFLQKLGITCLIWFGVAVAKKIVIPTIIIAVYPALTRLVRDPTSRGNTYRSLTRYLTYAIYVIAILGIVYVWAYSFLGTYIAGILGSGLIVALTFILGLFTSSVLGNILAYGILDGTDEFKLNDRVQIGEHYGDIIEVGFFFTRIKTIKDEIVSIPNLTIMAKDIKNFSALKNVLIYIPITLGYDIDKEEAKRLLIKCAEMTKDIVTDIPDKKPFVLLKDLGNYTVTYEINAYTDKPQRLVEIKSELIDNILTEFKKANMELLSPTHIAVRQYPTTTGEAKTYNTLPIINSNPE